MLPQYQPIKVWAEDDQPREKLLYKGKHTLSDAEILAIIIGSGTKRKSAVDLAREILETVKNDWAKLAKMSVPDLKKFNGIGDAKAISIIAALEMGRRRKDFVPEKITKIISSKDVYQHLKHHFLDLPHEEFRALYLNRSNHILGDTLIGKGGISSTVADGKLIFKHALEYAASAIILCHNHPSGNLKASPADVQLTKNMLAFGKCIDINILDHVIFTDRGHYSLADEGLM